MKRAITIALLLPAHAAAQVPLPHACTMEYVAIVGDRAPCSGVLSPAADAIEGATCIDADLPTCRALRARDADTYQRRAVMLAEAVSASDAMAERWRRLAMVPVPVAPPVTVIRERGLPGWVVGAIATGAAAIAGWLGWQARGSVR